MERKFDVKAYATSKAQIEKMTFYQNDTGASSILFEVNQDPQSAMDGIVSSSVTLQNPDETDNKTFGMEYITITGNVIDFTLPNWALSEEGTYNGQIMVYGSDSKRLTMTNFKYKVNSQIPNGVNNDDSDIPILTELINSTNEVMNRHEDNYEEALALSATNANLEIVDARKGEANLGVKIGIIDSSLEERANEIKKVSGAPLSRYPRINVETNDTPRIGRAFSENDVVVLDSDININGVNIPDNSRLICNARYTITTTDTVDIGERSSVIAPFVTVDGSGNTSDGFNIFSFAKWAKISIYEVFGHVNEGNVKGSGCNAVGFYCDHSDFVQIDVWRALRYLKVGFYIKSGLTGSGDTVNRSYLNCPWMGDVYKCFLSDESTSIQIDTSAYMEQCHIGFELRAGFYGNHNLRFDNVDDWFVNLLPSYRTRMGDVYIRNCNMSELIPQINGSIDANDRYFMYTTFHLNDGVIAPHDKDNPFTAQFQSFPGGRFGLKAGSSSVRYISDEAILRDGKQTDNDTAGGNVTVLGLAGSKSVTERPDGEIIDSIDYNGNVYIRGSVLVGKNDTVNRNLVLTKGGVGLGRTPVTNLANDMIGINSDNNKLVFKDHNGVLYNIDITPV